jgi:hypothetical protein
MTKTIAEAMIMYDWSPELYHWFRFSLLESPPIASWPSVKLYGAGAPIHEYDMAADSAGCKRTGRTGYGDNGDGSQVDGQGGVEVGRKQGKQRKIA